MKAKITPIIGLIMLLLPMALAADTINERFSRYYDKLSSGSNTVFIDIEKISIVRLNLDILETAYNVRVYLSTFSYNPASLPLMDDVYQYHNILVTNLDKSKMKSIGIEFRIPKTYITQYNIDKNMIEMYKLENNIWKKLEVKKLAEDISYIYYQTSADSFSYYAIVAKKNIEEKPVIVEKIVENKTNATIPKTEEKKEEPKKVVVAETKERSFFTSPIFFIILFTLISTGVIGFFAVRKYLHTRLFEDDLAVSDVNPGQYLRLSGNHVIKNLYDLLETLQIMNSREFSKHVNEEKNEFADWVSSALRDNALGFELKLKKSQNEMLTTVENKITQLEKKQLVTVISKKYGMFPAKTKELTDFVFKSRESGVNNNQIIQKLISQKYAPEMVFDLVYGTYDDVEDITIHPEDEAMINQFIHEAAVDNQNPEQIKIELLDSGWPRFVVEKKIREQFKGSN
ncbi:hypothetical protein COT47_07630 [Candidatus Woesearchaeota archaeon CG08_land_8_20_14_0_20_43_7]|nr:MAG: hypothetical protein COT47_07630 [Candidatus Woesearchaeota archaeon CG08_land_8_20_14_0_20_43_7]